MTKRIAYVVVFVALVGALVAMTYIAATENSFFAGLMAFALLMMAFIDCIAIGEARD